MSIGKLTFSILWLSGIIVPSVCAEGKKQQPLAITDSVFVLNEVEILSKPRTQTFASDTKTETIDSVTIARSSAQNIGQLLYLQSALNVKAYGGGASSSLSLRGATSSQTQVNWNGFPINSITLGTCDLSLIPLNGFDQISLIYGASGALYGSGSFGGAVNLDNQAEFKRGFHASAGYNYNTLQTHSWTGYLNVADNKIEYSFNIWNHQSDNIFTYIDYINQNVEHTQTDGPWHDKGIIHNLAIKTGENSTIDFGVWYQLKDYQIPSRVGSTSYEFQKDSSLRLFARYKQLFDHSSLIVKTAFFDNDQEYKQKSGAQGPNSIESSIRYKQFLSDINYRIKPHHNWVIDLGLTSAHNEANVGSYNSKKIENQLALVNAIRYETTKIDYNFTWRYEWNQGYDPQLLFSTGAVYSPLQHLKLRGNIAQKYRNPTFNDRYWIGGGNPDIKPESGYSFELGSEYQIQSTDKANQLLTDISLYYTHINEMIAWFPAGIFWAPNNFQEVISKGADIKIQYDYHRSRTQFRSLLNVNLNHSVITESPDPDQVGHTLYYSPRIMASWQNTFQVGQSGIAAWYRFTSDRFDTSNELLDYYQIVGINIFTGFNINRCQTKIGFIIDNLFDQYYELVMLYPMPGRVYSFKINLTI